jgi:Tol biopolymer transport system component/DNA-binding winged helix-turn-helix (wHTH) protein
LQINDGSENGAYYQFDSYTLDPDSGTLRYGNKLVELTPKVFTTLLVLVEHRDTVLTKDELLTIIWPDQFVDQSNLSQNISVLRKSLGEAESGKKYIATFPRHGYRFVGPVEVKRHCEDNRATPPPDPASSAVNEVQATSINVEPSSRSGRSKSTLRYWNSTSIAALCVVTLVVLVAFAIGKGIQNSKLRSILQDNTPVTVYARMNAGLAQPSWSRDGSAIAFVALDLSGTQSAIYVQMKGDIQPHKLVSDSGQFSSPAWSPDGRLLAFLHFEPDTAELVIFDMQRKSSRILTKFFAHRYGLNYRHLDWSADGKFLVVDDKSQDSEPFSLYLIYIDSGQRVRLTYPDSDMIGDVSPRVSPDGTKVAFIRDIDFFEQDVYITSARGRTYQRLTSAHALISDVGWKTNNILAFAADRGDGFRFWQVDLAKLDEKETIASRVSSDRALQFSVSQIGKTVAFSNYSPNLDIWSIDLTNPSNRWVPVIQAPGENIRPAVSPDGKFLAFLSNVSGKFQIWVSQIDGTSASEVPTGTLVPASFCWSSDGKSLVFSPQRVHGLYEVSVHGDAPVRQISSMYTDPHYASDGKSLFVREHFFIYRVPLKGGNVQEETEQGGAPMAQSRDGRYLYFSQGRMSTTIAKLDLLTGNQGELTGSLLPGYSDAWALSSQGIFFLGEEHNQPAVSFFNFATRREEHIDYFAGDLPQIEMSGFGISPDGRRLWAVRAVPTPSDVETTMFRSD